MPKSLTLIMEVAGCPTACMHCSVRGRTYEFMSLDDVARGLDQARQFCRQNHLAFYAFPMHEVLAHPGASEVLKLFKAHLPERWSLQPIATTGVPLGTREDWRDLLATAEALGTTTYWFAFHGVGEVHDRLVNHEGAYRAACDAVERARSMGFECGCNVFLTKANLRQVDLLVEALHTLGIEQMSWEVANYFPNTRARLYESLRPEQDDLLPLAGTIQQITRFKKDRWENIAAYTEAAYVRRARSIEDESREGWYLNTTMSGDVRLVCRHNLDVHSGDAGLYGSLHGNLREDNAAKIFQQGFEYGEYQDASLFFSAQRGFEG